MSASKLDNIMIRGKQPARLRYQQRLQLRTGKEVSRLIARTLQWPWASANDLHAQIIDEQL